jgi:methyl-accepting chemotaxis protein
LASSGSEGPGTEFSPPATVPEPPGRVVRLRRWISGSAERLREARRRDRLDRPSAARIRALSEELMRTVEAAEPRFLDLGGRLQNLYAHADGMVKRTRRAAAAAGGDGETGLPARLDAMVRDALADLAERRESIGTRLGEAMGSVERLGRLVDICAGMGKTGMSLNVIGLNIAVESSRTAASGEMFSAFVEEIRGLSGRVSGISETIRESGDRTRRDQIAAHRKIRAGLDALSRMVVEAETIVNGSLEQVRELMARSRRVLERSTDRSREIGRIAGEVVVAIQFHDITRQKVEHVAAALGDAIGLLERPGEPMPTVRGRVHRLLSLQGNQLRQVVDDIHAARRRAAEAFGNLESLVGELVADAALLDVRGGAEDRLDRHRQGLEEGLRRLRNLLERGRDLDREIRRIAEEGAEAASGLSEHIDRVRAISFDLHLKALNAVVKSARLFEEGRALEVLAQEVSKLSVQSGGFVDDVVEILESLVSLSLDLDLMDAAEEETADRSLAAGLDEVARGFDEFQADAAGAPERARDLQAETEEAAEALGFLDKFGAAMSGRIAELAAVVEGFAPWSEAARLGSTETLEQAARRYTMESERRLHVRHFGEAVAAGIPAAGLLGSDGTGGEEPDRGPTDETEADIDDEAMDPEARTDGGIGDSGFGEASDAPGDSGNDDPDDPADDPADDLGDNVELF